MSELAVELLDTVVIGAGVVGLACARAIAKRSGEPVFVVEQHPRSGEETSSHNSGVIHAGIYYPQGSLKADLCVKGNRQLYAYAKEKRIPHKKLGKLIVAKEPQREALQALYNQATSNGVVGLTWLEKSDINQREPNVNADIAIHSSTTGIIDAAALTAQLEADVCALGATVLFKHQVSDIKRVKNRYQLTINNAFILSCRHLVNAAGLSATQLAQDRPTYFAKGQYYNYQTAAPFSQLVYPLPEPNQQGLGIHATLNLAGQVQFGPDVQFQATPSYAFDESRKLHFVRAIQDYFPDVNSDKLKPGQTGIRPKLSQAGEPAEDFHIAAQRNGSAVLINLFGIESPGLTASLAIGDYVSNLLNE